MKIFWGIVLLAFFMCPVNAGTLDCFQNLPQEIPFGSTAGTTLNKMAGNIRDYEKQSKGAGYSIPYMNTACIVSVYVFKTGYGLPMIPPEVPKTVSADISTTIRNYSVNIHSSCSAMFRFENKNRQLAEAVATTVQKNVIDSLKGCLR